METVQQKAVPNAAISPGPGFNKVHLSLKMPVMASGSDDVWRLMGMPTAWWRRGLAGLVCSDGAFRLIVSSGWSKIQVCVRPPVGVATVLRIRNEAGHLGSLAAPRPIP